MPKRVFVWATPLALAAALALGAAIALPLRDDEPSGPAPGLLPSHPIDFYDEREFARALNTTTAAPVEPMPSAHVLIVPHHWLAGHLILEGVRDLAATRHISRVILVGPDHVNAGSTPATTSRFAWDTPFGQLGPDPVAIEGLISAARVQADPATLENEHSIASLVHAVAYYLPDAKLVPIALRNDMTLSEVISLAAAVKPLVHDETAVIVAEDFSHYLSAPEAESHDEQTIAALSSFASERVMGWGNEHLDSPPSVAFAIELATLLGDDRFVLRDNTNSGILDGTLLPPVTSYITGYYTGR